MSSKLTLPLMKSSLCNVYLNQEKTSVSNYISEAYWMYVFLFLHFLHNSKKGETLIITFYDVLLVTKIVVDNTQFFRKLYYKLSLVRTSPEMFPISTMNSGTTLQFKLSFSPLIVYN